jgi:hypothetical protein
MSEDYQSAALRHLAEAEVLAANACWVGAGHLVGLAAECAIKHRIETLQPAQRAPHAHFPEIVEVAKRHLARRRDLALKILLNLPNLMAGWMISLRYHSDDAVGKVEYDLWHSHTIRLVHAAGLRRRTGASRS